MTTKQDLMVKILQERGGALTSIEMRTIMDESPQHINVIAYHVQNRGLIKIVKVPISHLPFYINKFVLTEKGKNKIIK